jgi:hypothetical protein
VADGANVVDVGEFGCHIYYFVSGGIFMPSSYPTFRQETRDYILKNFDPVSTRVIDVGPGDGTYARLLPEFKLDCVEVFEPYVDRFNLKSIYDQVFVKDVRDFDFVGYDLAILGDVLEHLRFFDAFLVLAKLGILGMGVVVQVPFLFEQGSWEGNDFEAHLQPDLKHEVFMERYGGLGLSCLVRCPVCGVYVRKK